MKRIGNFCFLFEFLKFLSSLDLNFSLAKFSNEGVKVLITSLKECTLLSNLQLNFYECKKINSDGFDCFEEFANYKRLYKLSLDKQTFVKLRGKRDIIDKICSWNKNLKIY